MRHNGGCKVSYLVGTHVPVVHRICSQRAAHRSIRRSFTHSMPPVWHVCRATSSVYWHSPLISQIGFMMVALGVCTSATHTKGDWATWQACSTYSHTPCSRHCCSSERVASSMPYTATRCLPWVDCGSICPITHITFLIACLAIAGIPPFSGFFSKDES